MENRINIAELLKDCPNGMELDCTMYDNVKFIGVEEYDKPICIRVGDGDLYFHLTKFGTWNFNKNAKCVIFPKGKTTWEGFVPPCKFKDGDVIFTHANCLKVGLGNTWISIFQEKRNGGVATYVDMSEDGEDYYDYIVGDKALLCMDKDIMRQRLATEEEKQKLFQAIEENGYKWNAETKTLEKLPKFKIEKGKWYVCIRDLLDRYANKAFCKGDIYLSTQDGSLIPSNSNVPFEVVCASTYFRDWTIQDAKDGDVLAAYECLVLFKKLDGLNIKCYCTYHFMNNPSFYVDTLQNKTAFHPATEEEKQKLFEAIKANDYNWNPETKILEKLPKFKVGDRIKEKGTNTYVHIKAIKGDKYQTYYETLLGDIPVEVQDNWELIPNKFDVNTLKPFDKVLVRDGAGFWRPSLFGKDMIVGYRYFTACGNYKECIPYENNEHLLGTRNDCDDFYKTWE